MASTPSSCAMSPISDIGSDDGKFKQGSYYAQIVGISPKEPIKEREIDVILQDHAYSKPWSAHPDASHARPTRTLFLTRQPKPQPKPQRLVLNKDKEEELIDIDSYTIRNVSAYDEAKARVVKDECERHVSCFRLDPGNLDWEENLGNLKANWSVSQNRLFSKILKILHSDRLARLAYVNHPNEPVLRRICVDRTTKRFRQAMAFINWDSKLSQWLHATLVEHASHSYLAAYMDVLQTLKAKIPSLIDKMVAQSLVANRVGAKTAEAVALVLKRPWDPVAPQFVSHKAKKLPGAPLLLLVPSGPAHPVSGNSKRMRFWNTQLAAMGKVIPVTMHAVNAGSSLTVSQCLEHLIGAIRTKVSELQTHFPNRSIVLIGWNVGALAACHVALVESVSSVVCLGFPFVGMNGKRGDVDDPLLECKIPIIFFIGQNSNLCRQDDLEEMREHMRCETSLVVIGGADDNLRLSHAKKKLDGVTTSMVDRCLLDEISDFLGPVLTRHQNHSLDTSYTSTGSTNSSDSSSVKDGRKRKKKVLPGLAQDLRTYTFSPAIRRKTGASVKNKATGTKNPKVLMHSSAVGTSTGKRQLSLTAKRRRIQISPVSTPSPNKRRPMWSTATADSLSSDSSNQSQPSLSTPAGLDLGQDEPDIINIGLNDSPKRVQRGISVNIGSISSLTQFNRNYSNKPVSAACSSELDGSQMPHVVYKRMVGPIGVSGTTYSDIISRGRGSRLKITRGGNISSRNSAFFAIPKSSTTTTSGMSSLLSGAGRSNFLFATVPPRESLLSNQIVEPDQSQVQAIQRLQFHDFPLTTASLTNTVCGNPILTQAKILSNLNKMEPGSSTTTTSASTIRQNVIPGIGSTINTTQSLLSSGSSAFVRNTNIRKAYIASSGAVLGPKQNSATSLLLGSKVTQLIGSSLCEIVPSMSLHIPNKQLSGKPEEVAVLMLSDPNEKVDDDLPSSDLDINKALGGVDLTGSDDNLLDMIGDIEGALGENPLESFGGGNESETGVSELGIPSGIPLDALDLPLRQFDPPKTDDALLESSLEMFSDMDPLLQSPGDQELSDLANNLVQTSTSRLQRPVFPTIASTRTRRIRTPKYYDV